jgi:hypothetical protein
MYIKMDLKVTGCGAVRYIEVARDSDEWRAFVNTLMNDLVP